MKRRISRTVSIVVTNAQPEQYGGYTLPWDQKSHWNQKQKFEELFFLHFVDGIPEYSCWCTNHLLVLSLDGFWLFMM